MPTVADTILVAANTEVDVLNGTAFEFPPGARGNVYTVLAVNEVQDIVLDVEFGTKIQGRGIPLRVAGVGVTPSTDQDVKIRERALPGEKIRAILRNPTGTGRTASILIDIS